VWAVKAAVGAVLSSRCLAPLVLGRSLGRSSEASKAFSTRDQAAARDANNALSRKSNGKVLRALLLTRLRESSSNPRFESLKNFGPLLPDNAGCSSASSAVPVPTLAKLYPAAHRSSRASLGLRNRKEN